MNLIFAKLFEEYIKKNDPAEIKITAYISIFYFLLMFVLLLPIKTFVDKNIFQNQLKYNKTIVMFFIFSILAIIMYNVYIIYIKKKHIYKLLRKYKKRKLNKVILYLIVALTPVTMLLFAGTLTVYINGGEILGHEIKGLLE